MLSGRKRASKRPHLYLIALIGVIVPRRVRAAWRQEWEAELRYREEMLAQWDRLDWRSKCDLLRRSTSAFWDALWLQTYRWEDEMIQDLRYGIRMLMRNPGFALVAIVTLALGIGANTAIFSVINGVLLRPLGFYEPDRLLIIWTDNPAYQLGFHEFPAANADLPEWREAASSFEQIGVFQRTLSDLSEDGDPERIGGVEVSANLVPMLGVEPILGRHFSSDEEKPGQDRVAIISHDLWQRRFGGDPDI